jgi:hypothetical protein
MTAGPPADPAKAAARARARHFVLLLGWVSLFSDLCYEGMRGAIGGYLAVLGASATAVGLVAGTGEAIGYGLRYASGALADKTQRYWGLAIAGYATNLVAVPLLAFAGSWPMVAVLVGLERLGKAVRSPAKSTLTSFGASDLGAGKAFAINEAMDQVGGFVGPLVVAAILMWRGETVSGYGWAFCALGIPAAITIGILLRARRLYPDPRALDTSSPGEQGALSPRYKLYLVGVALVAIGLADWPLLAYHLQKAHVLSGRWLPVAYSAAAAVDGVTAFLAGHRRRCGRGVRARRCGLCTAGAFGVRRRARPCTLPGNRRPRAVGDHARGDRVDRQGADRRDRAARRTRPRVWPVLPGMGRRVVGRQPVARRALRPEPRDRFRGRRDGAGRRRRCHRAVCPRPPRSRQRIAWSDRCTAGVCRAA